VEPSAAVTVLWFAELTRFCSHRVLRAAAAGQPSLPPGRRGPFHGRGVGTGTAPAHPTARGHAETPRPTLAEGRGHTASPPRDLHFTPTTASRLSFPPLGDSVGLGLRAALRRPDGAACKMEAGIRLLAAFRAAGSTLERWVLPTRARWHLGWTKLGWTKLGWILGWIKLGWIKLWDG